MIWKFFSAIFGGWFSSWWETRRQRKQIAQASVEHTENVQMKHEISEEENANAEKAKAIADVRAGDLDQRVRAQYVD